MSAKYDPIFQLFKGTSYITGIRIISALVGIGSISILTRSLPKGSVGIYFILLQIGNIASLFCKVGLDQGNQRFISGALVNSPGIILALLRRQRILFTVGTSGTLVFLYLVWSFLAGRMFSSDVLAGLVFFQLAMVVILSLEQMQSSTLRAMKKLFQSAVSETCVRQIVFFCLLSTLFVSSKSSMKIEAVLSMWLVGGCINVIMGFLWIRQAVKGDRELYRQRGSVPGFIDMLKECVPMGLANCMAIIRGSSDVLIIGWLLGASEAGLYGPLKRVSKLVVFLLGAIAKTLSPIVATLYAEQRIVELEAVCRKSANIASIVGIPVALFFFVWGDWFLCLVFGNEYRNMGLLLSILILGPVSRALLGSPGIVLQMTGHEVVVMKVNFIISFLTILLMAVFVIPFGLYAIAVVSSALLFIQFLLLSSLVCRKLEFRTYISVGPVIRS